MNVTCPKCARKLRVRDDLAGKRVKCPGCGSAIRVPAGGAAGAGEAAPEGQGRKCPQCGKVYPLDVAICTDCGIHLRTGRRAGARATPSAWTGRARWLVGGAVVLIVAAVAYFVLRGPGAPEGPLEVLPGSASVVGRLSVGDLLRIPALRDGVTQVKNQGDYKALQAAGVSLDTLEQVHFGVDPSKAVDGGEPDGVAVIEFSGPVDMDKLAEALEQSGALQEKISVRGRSAFVLDSEQSGPRPVMTAVGENRLVVGTRAMVEASVALAAGEGESVADNSALMRVCEDGELDDLFWLAIRLPETQRDQMSAKLGPGTPVDPKEIQSGLIRANYAQGRGLSLGAALVFASEESATQARPQLEGMAQTVQMFLPGEDGLVRVTQEGDKLDLSADLSEETLAQLASQAKAGASQAAMPPQAAEGEFTQGMQAQTSEQGPAVADESMESFLPQPAGGQPEQPAQPAAPQPQISPVEQHLAQLREGGAGRQEAVAFFADYEEPLGDHKAALVDALVALLAESEGLARRKDDNLRARAVELLRKVEPAALKRAYPQLSGFLREVYLPVRAPLVQGGMLYVSCEAPRLVALDLETYEEQWSREQSFTHAPVLRDGTLYAGARALDPATGEEKWHYTPWAGAEPGSPLLVTEDKVYFGADQCVCAVNADNGEEAWVYKLGNETSWPYAPVLAGDVLCIAEDGHAVYGLNADSGEQVWQFEVATSPGLRPVLYGGRLYVPADHGVYALNPKTGDKLAKTERFGSAPLMAGNFMVAREPSTDPRACAVVALDLRNGTVAWRTELGRDLSFNHEVAPISDGERICFVTTTRAARTEDMRGQVTALAQDTGRKLWTFTLPEGSTVAWELAYSDGRLYVPANDYTVFELHMATGQEVTYGVEPSAPPPAEEPEPPVQLAEGPAQEAPAETPAAPPPEEEEISQEEWERRREEAELAKQRREMEEARVIEHLAAAVVTLDLEQEPLEQVLKMFEEESDVRFVMAPELAQRYRVTLRVRNTMLLDVFLKILNQHGLEHTVKDGAIHVHSKSSSGGGPRSRGPRTPIGAAQDLVDRLGR